MFTILTGGINSRHNAAFYMERPEGLKNYVLLVVKSKAAFSIDGHEFTVLPDSAVFIKPYTPYQYRPLGNEYTDDWLHFQVSADAPDVFESIPFHTPIALHASSRYTEYLRQLLWENSYAPPQIKGENVDMLLRIILNNIRQTHADKNNGQPYSPYRIPLQELRLSVLSQPGKRYHPEELAASMGISLSYFQHLYSSVFGISFQADLISSRINYARDLIAHTNLTMENIAEMCGYANEVHFYRQFKKYTGITPAACRKLS